MSNNLELLAELRLSGIKNSLDYRLEESIKDNLSYQDFLSLILDDEMIYRKNRKSERLTRKAKFNNFLALDEFEASTKRGVPISLIKKFQSLDFLYRHENLIFSGGTGAGKSYLAQAIGHLCCHDGYDTIFLPINKMFKEIEAAEASGEYLKYIAKLKKARLLIFDDFGLRNYSHQEATILYDILEEKYQKGSIIITTQVHPEGWKTLFEDEVIAEAIVDRARSCAHEIKVKGDSYRKNHEPKKMVAK